MRTARTAIALIAAATLVRLVLAALVPLFPHEAYYWEWSRHLAAGYVDHPPAIALLIRGGTSLFGATAMGVRFVAVVAGAVASWAVMLLAGRLAVPRSDTESADGRPSPAEVRAESRAALLMGITPAALVGFVLATPDAPLLASVALTLVALERAIAAAPRSRETLGWWAAAGIALGLAFCSAYTAVLLPIAVFIALLARRELRIRLAEPGPYVAALITILLFAPTVIWNAGHHWVSFAFQLRHGLRHGLGAGHGSAIAREASLIGGPLGLISPILAIMAAIAVAHGFRRTADDRRFLLAVVATAMIAFFTVNAIRTPADANVPAIALLAALPLLAAWDFRARARGWFIAGCALAATCTVAIVIHAVTGILPLVPTHDLIARAHGWDDLSLSVSRARGVSATASCATTLVAAGRYQDASEFAYHLPDHPRVFALDPNGRPDQYDLWPDLYSTARPDDCALVIVNDDASGDAVIRRIHADSAMRIGSAAREWKGKILARSAIWLVRGIPWSPPPEVNLSPAVRAALDSTARMFISRSSALDSIVRVFRHGPAPYVVQAGESGPPPSNSDRRAEINARMTDLHGRLARARALSVYRDSRYVECTFVRTRMVDSADVGYLYAPEGCSLARNESDPRVYVEKLRGAWYAYAAP